MSDKPITVAIATYASKSAADQDYDAIHGIKHQGQLDHLAIAVVERQADGDLKIDRHNSSAKHAAWGTGVLGGALTVISAPLGIVLLGPLAATSAVWAAVGGFAGHFWRNIPKDTVREMSDVLERGEFGLVIVAVNPNRIDIGALLSGAEEVVVSDDVADTESALEQAFDQIAA